MRNCSGFPANYRTRGRCSGCRSRASRAAKQRPEPLLNVLAQSRDPLSGGSSSASRVRSFPLPRNPPTKKTGATVDGYFSYSRPKTVEWENRSTMGRDHRVKVARMGYLYPWGNEAVFIDLTERKILPSLAGPDAAYLRYRLFLVVTQPPQAGNTKEHLTGRAMRAHPTAGSCSSKPRPSPEMSDNSPPTGLISRPDEYSSRTASSIASSLWPSGPADPGTRARLHGSGPPWPRFPLGQQGQRACAGRETGRPR